MKMEQLPQIARELGEDWVVDNTSYKGTSLRLGKGGYSLKIEVAILKKACRFRLFLGYSRLGMAVGFGAKYGINDDSFTLLVAHSEPVEDVAHKLKTHIVQPAMHTCDILKDQELWEDSSKRIAMNNVAYPLGVKEINKSADEVKVPLHWSGTVRIIPKIRTAYGPHAGHISPYHPRISLSFEDITQDLAEHITKAVSNYVNQEGENEAKGN